MTSQECFDLAIAREYRDRPYGRHSPTLQALLTRMRQPGFGEEWLVVMIEPNRRYALARRRAGQPPELLTNHIYDRIEDCEWAVFRLRWKSLTGEDPEVA
jgi:hypothetical protein